MLSPVKLWRNQKQIQRHLGKKGDITSFTIIRIAPAGFEGQAPYPVAIVSLGKGDRLIGQLVNWNKKHLCIGQKVEVVIRRTHHTHPESVIPYGIKFKPIT